MFSAQQRRTAPRSIFGLPSQRKYPTDTPGRARAAISYSTTQFRRGTISRAQMQAIHAKAHARLGR